jgi:glycosyltransferase involved in cell wall biosynthesis
VHRALQRRALAGVMTQGLADTQLERTLATSSLPLMSVVVPVYGNVETLAELVGRLESVSRRLGGGLEAIFVIDGSPDDSGALLRTLLRDSPLRSRLAWHSRNFGAFAAVRTGLGLANGRCIAVMAADLQEPVELLEEFHAALADGRHDVALGVRRSRRDPVVSQLGSSWFWAIYTRWVQPQMPRGGVDVFACTPQVRDALLALEESNTSLVGLLIWLGFRRVEVPYDRQPRLHGSSAWTARKKVRYLLDSVYSFTDLPINLLLGVGVSGVLLSLICALVVFVTWMLGDIKVAGYTPLMLTLLVMGSLTLSGLGVVGSYVWRTYENSKRRPGAVKTLVEDFDAPD